VSKTLKGAPNTRLCGSPQVVIGGYCDLLQIVMGTAPERLNRRR